MDVLLLAVRNEFWLEETWVALDLVGGGGDTSAVNESLEVLLGVVGHADSASLLLGQLSHSLPGVDDANAVEHLDVAIGLVRLLHHREKLVVRVVGLVKCEREMHQVQI